MRISVFALACAACLVLAQDTSSQIPSVPGLPTAPVASAAPAAPTKNIYSFLLPSAEQQAACKVKLASCPPVQMLKAILNPACTLFGAGLPGAVPTAADLAKPPTSSAGAAARIQQVNADAKARRAQIRYLGTVDCRYFPEAEAALVAALRTDPSECVRYEAALGLNRGCCCTKKTAAALRIAAFGQSEDQHPSECSPRVRAAAANALARCESMCAPAPGPVPLPSEKPVPSGVDPASLVLSSRAEPPPAGTADATGAAVRPSFPVEIPTGQRGLIQIFRRTLAQDTGSGAPARQ